MPLVESVPFVMLSNVLGVAQNLQVFKPIVQFIVINVMDNFLIVKLSSQEHLHNITMLVLLFTVFVDHTIASHIYRANTYSLSLISQWVAMLKKPSVMKGTIPSSFMRLRANDTLPMVAAPKPTGARTIHPMLTGLSRKFSGTNFTGIYQCV